MSYSDYSNIDYLNTKRVTIQRPIKKTFVR